MWSLQRTRRDSNLCYVYHDCTMQQSLLWNGSSKLRAKCQRASTNLPWPPTLLSRANSAVKLRSSTRGRFPCLQSDRADWKLQDAPLGPPTGACCRGRKGGNYDHNLRSALTKLSKKNGSKSKLTGRHIAGACSSPKKKSPEPQDPG